jgi:hypothetical protein
MQKFRFIKLAGLSILGVLGLLVVLAGTMILWNSLDIIKCPAFDKSLSSWFPYQKGETLTFIAKNGQTGNAVFFDSLHIQHRKSYNSELKCGTCGDRVEAIFKIGRSNLVVVTEGGDAMFDPNPFTAINDSLPTDVKRDASTLQLLWADSASASGITAVCFKKSQGLVWYEQNKQKFYGTSKTARAVHGELVISNISGCQ